MERELMTVKAFAEAAGITTQRVYQLTKSTLKEYTMTIAKGKKRVVMVYKDGLELINCKELQGIAKTCKGDLQRAQTTQQSDTGDFLGGDPCKDLQSACKEDIATAEALDVLRAELEAYRDQLKAKDDQIAYLQSHVDRQQQTIDKLTDALTQQQALNAAAAVIQKQLIDGAAEASKDTGPSTSSTGTATATPSADGTPSAGAADNKQRRGIFGALDTIRAKFKR